MKIIATALCAAQLLLVSLTAFSQGGDESTQRNTRSEIEQIEQREKKVRSSIVKDNQRMASNRRELQSLNRQVKKINASIEDLQRTQKNLSLQQGTGKKRIEALQKQLEQHEERLYTLLRAVHRIWITSRALPQFADAAKRNDEVLRRRHYAFLVRGSQGDYNHYRGLTQNLQENQAAVSARTQRVDSNARKLLRQRSRVAVARERRNQIVSQLQGKIVQGNRELKNLNQRKQQLENLLRRLEEPTDRRSSTNLAGMRGQLLRPLKALAVIRRYGSRNENGEPWHGVQIEAVGGTGVQAVATGTIAYAQALAGVGDYLVIDHGDGYMSIYGEVELLIEQGAKVSTGQVVARVRSNRPELFFALRHRSEWLNPERWLGGSW